MSHDENILIQVRARLREFNIQLWEKPYYEEESGPVEEKLNELAVKFGKELNIDIALCLSAIQQLQNRALQKISARKEYDITGIARFNIRLIGNGDQANSSAVIKCSLNDFGSELLNLIANLYHLEDINQVKCIAAGKIVNSNQTLGSQGLKNNQQLLVMISQIDRSQSDSKEEMYDRIHKIKMDIESIVNSGQQYFEMEDQDGKPVFLPPQENRAILMAMGFCEKARAAMKREHYDEALILLLEADQKFAECNSNFLETVDNYALVNLDIVWCYLLLKNLNELPDAERRLKLCEESFQRTYGDNMLRLVALKGNASQEKALIMRLHLLQGVVLFHKNMRKEAYEKFECALKELSELKIDDKSVMVLMEMGYDQLEARLGLRASNGNIERAVQFIHERREKLRESRKKSAGERKMHKKFGKKRSNESWVNPRSIYTLVQMGFDRDIVVEALRVTKNDLQKSLDLLQTNPNELRKNLPEPVPVDENLLKQLKDIGFDDEMARVALETSINNIEEAIDFLVNMLDNKEDILQTISAAVERASNNLNGDYDGPSTSQGTSALHERVIQKAKEQIDSLDAYNRFNEDISHNEDEYLDLPLIQEENFLMEYKSLLEN